MEMEEGDSLCLLPFSQGNNKPPSHFLALLLKRLLFPTLTPPKSYLQNTVEQTPAGATAA